MAAIKAKLIFLLVLFVLLQSGRSSFCQTSTIPIHKWVNELKGKKDSAFNVLLRIKNQLEKSDSATAFRALAELEENGPASDHYFNAGLLYIKGWVHKQHNPSTGKMHAKRFCADALKEAYYTGDEAFTSFISWSYGALMAHYNEIELAAAYMVNAVELNTNFFAERAASKDSTDIPYLGEILFHARVYSKSIYYTCMAIDSFKSWPGSSEWVLLKAWDTLGQAYQKMGNLDSALLCYQISSALASRRRTNHGKELMQALWDRYIFCRASTKRQSHCLTMISTSTKTLITILQAIRFTGLVESI